MLTFCYQHTRLESVSGKVPGTFTDNGWGFVCCVAYISIITLRKGRGGGGGKGGGAMGSLCLEKWACPLPDKEVWMVFGS